MGIQFRIETDFTDLQPYSREYQPTQRLAELQNIGDHDKAIIDLVIELDVLRSKYGRAVFDLGRAHSEYLFLQQQQKFLQSSISDEQGRRQSHQSNLQEVQGDLTLGRKCIDAFIESVLEQIGRLCEHQGLDRTPDFAKTVTTGAETLNDLTKIVGSISKYVRSNHQVPFYYRVLSQLNPLSLPPGLTNEQKLELIEQRPLAFFGSVGALEEATLLSSTLMEISRLERLVNQQIRLACRHSTIVSGLASSADKLGKLEAELATAQVGVRSCITAQHALIDYLNKIAPICARTLRCVEILSASTVQSEGAPPFDTQKIYLADEFVRRKAYFRQWEERVAICIDGLRPLLGSRLETGEFYDAKLSLLVGDYPLHFVNRRDVIIRATNRRDVGDIVSIEAVTSQFPIPEDEILAKLRNPSSVATIAEKVVGFMIYKFYDDAIFLGHFGVSPRAQRFGVGTMLIDQLKNKLSNHINRFSNLRRSQLFVAVDEEDYQRMSFLKRNGFNMQTQSQHESTEQAGPNQRIFMYRAKD